MLIAIEGIDGSGKGTQSKLLASRLRQLGEDVELLDFPRYSSTFFGKEIGHYLNGEFGELMEVHPKLGALLYAGDRFESKDLINSLLVSGRIVICDRFTASNQAHHAAKLPPEKWNEFFQWVDTVEHEVFGVPRPDLIIFLKVGADISARLIKQKPPRIYTKRDADIHEISPTYQTQVFLAYEQLLRHSHWKSIDCMANNRLRNPDEISDMIWSFVRPCVSKRENFNGTPLH